MKDITDSNITCLQELTGKAENIAIVTHVHPDGDALGSSLGLRNFLLTKGKESDVIIPDRHPDSLEFLFEEDDRKHLTIASESIDKAVGLIAGADLIICLDFNSFKRADGLTDALYSATCPKILFDHHLNPEREAFNLVFSETEISSACEVLYTVLLALPDVNGNPSALGTRCGECLLTGMTTDTNNFGNSVYPSTLGMASGLLAAGIDRDAIISNIYNQYREERFRLMGYLLSQKLVITSYGLAYMVLDKLEQKKFNVKEGDTEAFVNIPLGIGRVRMSIFAKEDDGYFRISIRSKVGTSANALARDSFHGGGHTLAAGGRLFIPEDISDAGDAASYIMSVTEKFFSNENQ